MTSQVPGRDDRATHGVPTPSAVSPEPPEPPVSAVSPESQHDPQSPPPPEPPDPGSPTAPDPEDWESTAVQGDDERYENERPPHWE